MGRILPATVLSFLVSGCALAQDEPATGQSLYAACANCHGLLGEGNRSLGAPKLAGREIWYLTRQLENFKARVRGADVHDGLGAQMVPMANSLPSDEDVAAVAAFIALSSLCVLSR